MNLDSATERIIVFEVDRAVHESQDQLERGGVGAGLGIDAIVHRLRAELTLRFGSPDDPGLYLRRRRLRALFGQLAPADAARLVARLGDRPTTDPLSQLFHGRLAAATRRDLLETLRSRIPASSPSAPVPPAPGPPAPPTFIVPEEPLPPSAMARFAAAAVDLRARVVASGDPRTPRMLCVLAKLAGDVDDRVIGWHRICPHGGAIGAAYVVGPCPIGLGRNINQTTLESAIRSVADVERADANLRISMHLRTEILGTYEWSPAPTRFSRFRVVHDDVQWTIRNLAEWADAPMGGSSAMPTAYRSIAGWIQRQRNNPRSVLSCF